jgi:formate-dependent nitrite reductase membrane component NrfD
MMDRTTPPNPAASARGGEQPRRRRGGRGEVPLVPDMTPTSYYGHAVLKAPVWTPEVATYLFTGGLAGGSAVLATAARATGNDELARRALWVGLAGAAISPALLIKDLGVPSRFYNMLRVVKVTSPMNVGTWILSGVGTCLGVATACDTLHILPRVQRVAEVSAAALGPALSTYTAVLLADTAVPAWHQASTELPFLFAASASASAGAAAVVVTPTARAALARSVAIGGVVAEVGIAHLMETRLGELGEAHRGGEAGRYGRAAKVLGMAGAVVLAGGGRRRPLAVLGGAAVLASSLCERWSVFKAGPASARDPRYTVAPQRRRLTARQAGGA